jgi:hypothetical protein
LEDKFVFWAVTTVISLSITVIGILIKSIWSIVFGDYRKWKEGIEKWKETIEKEGGGIVTRDKHFQWCGEKQSTCSEGVNCRLCEVEEWRKDMYEKGGPLTTQGHDIVCEKRANVLVSMVENSLKHYQEIVKKDLEIVMLSVKETVTEAVRQIKEANGRK